MTLERKIAKLFNLRDKNWMKPSNPWSVWTRYTVLPVIVFAFWSRIWMGWWYLIPAIISLSWIFFNPIFLRSPNQQKTGHQNLF